MKHRRAKPQVAGLTGKDANAVIHSLRCSQKQHVAKAERHGKMLEIWEQAIRKYISEQSEIVGPEAASRAWYDQVRSYMTLPGEKLTPSDLQYLRAVFNHHGVEVEGVNGLEEDWLLDNCEYNVVEGRKVPKNTPHKEAPSFHHGLVKALETQTPTLPPSTIRSMRQAMVGAFDSVRFHFEEAHGVAGERRSHRQAFWGVLLTEHRNKLSGYSGEPEAFSPQGELPPVV